MKHRQTKAQKYNDLAVTIGQIRRGEKVKRIGARDGSMLTKPVVVVQADLTEAIVLHDCIRWLRQHHIMCNRHDAATLQNERGQYGTYGIKTSGDIHGMLKHHGGRHFEIEAKRGSGGRLSLGQQKRMKKVRDNGGLYFVVHGVEELEHFMGEFV